MDLNELLYHHQMALMTVGRAQRAGRSAVSFDLPCYYARRINEYRKRRGLTFDIPVIAHWGVGLANCARSEEHTSALQSLMRTSSAVFSWKNTTSLTSYTFTC